MTVVVDIANERSYEELLLELPEAYANGCPACGAKEGELCGDPGTDCPVRCTPAAP